MTFSIVARSGDGESWGVAVASKFLAAGSAVPAAAAGVGAVATQAWANVGYKREGLALLHDGATAQETVARLLADDEGREHRQVGVVDVEGHAATYTGEECLRWAGGRTARSVAIQGNILVGPQVVEAMYVAWEHTEVSLPRRLLAALRAGDAAGGDARGRQSAALLVVRAGAGYDGRDDVAVDLRVDDHPDPCDELERLLDLHQWYLSVPEEQERIPLDDDLRTELERFARGRDAVSWEAWVGKENVEMRVGTSWVDRTLLSLIRESGSSTPGRVQDRATDRARDTEGSA
jgi:uncharacterized Ntn-hydrolase superfamily protein